jgi:hypothetical protein
MIVESKTIGGHRTARGPFLVKGLNEFQYRSLTRSQREFLQAMIEARLVKVLEEDAPAVVIPLPLPAAEPLPPPMKRRVRRAQKAG